MILIMDFRTLYYGSSIGPYCSGHVLQRNTSPATVFGYPLFFLPFCCHSPKPSSPIIY
ncbi:hypothetical protein HanHA89_Chr13g0501231 [Helianthus annuus]|nr:hypothetical protein HanHA89_Chr13g0501231 [Helianthus annuus]